jgi:NADH-quinone oxidoreductase subunit H
MLRDMAALLVFPGGLFLLAVGMGFEWLDNKLLARLQNRLGPRWFQPLADTIKLLAKEEIVPDGVNRLLFVSLPVVALVGALTAALYIPLWGLRPSYSFPGDLVVTVYLLSLLTLCTGLAGANTLNRFSLVGAIRALTQLFAYEAPFLLALMGPAIMAGSWQIDEITAFASTRLLLLTQPIGLLVAEVGLMGKLEMPPFDAPEAETETRPGSSPSHRPAQ